MALGPALEELLEAKGAGKSLAPRIIKLLDMIDKQNFEKHLNAIGEDTKQKIKDFLDNTKGAEILDTNSGRKLADVINLLKESGIEVKPDITLARGFNYYTGIVFEVFDTDEENNRSIFGGGRYDGLVVCLA